MKVGRGVLAAGVAVSARGGAGYEGSHVETERMKLNVVLKLPFQCPGNLDVGFQSDTQALRPKKKKKKGNFRSIKRFLLAGFSV